MEFRVAAVGDRGTRRPTGYGINCGRTSWEDLAARGLAITSGLARGLDAAAHRGALRAGITYAVFGSGLDFVYPKENRRLAEFVVENGAIISEFPLGTPPSPQNFPIRNRIIAGMSLGVTVVEAAEYSGSLITVRLALESGREIFAVPGNITSRTASTSCSDPPGRQARFRLAGHRGGASASDSRKNSRAARGSNARCA